MTLNVKLVCKCGETDQSIYTTCSICKEEIKIWVAIPDLIKLVEDSIETNKRLNYPMDYKTEITPADARIDELEDLLTQLRGIGEK